MVMHSQFDGPSGPAMSVTGTVKWFNPTKGFGFVQLPDSNQDAFLHISVVERAGRSSLNEGARIECEVAEGRRGPQVVEILSVEDADPAMAPMGGRPRPYGHGRPPMGGMGSDRGGGGPTEELEGTVKFFNAEKGFGFVTPDDGGKDVFISARTLGRLGLTSLDPGQRVRLNARMGHKGPMAESVELL